ncbi:MAG: ThiF family adenylyltransferase [Rickettsiales bacterium]|nr:ThiF family adenylyltransferase [Rickettsiales bacterium]
MRFETVHTLPDDLGPTDHSIYYWPAAVHDAEYYKQRTNRNIGWITTKEQEMLRGATVGMAGVGGIGGSVSMVLTQSGIANFKLADLEHFDVGNISRQFAATHSTVGMPKVKAVARCLRDISEDINMTLYPTGITEETIDHFLDGCDVVLDGIDLWAIGARVLLLNRAKERGITVFNCATIGFGSRIFKFTPEGKGIEELLGMDYAQAKAFEERVDRGEVGMPERVGFLNALANALVPELPSYAPPDAEAGHIDVIRKRLIETGAAAGWALSGWVSCSFVANQLVYFLLKDSGNPRHVVTPPPVPGYLYLDVGFMEAKAVQR